MSYGSVDQVAVMSIIQPFIDAGIVPPNCRRIILDFTAGDVVRIYYEIYGDERVGEVMGSLIDRGQLPKMSDHAFGVGGQATTKSGE